MAAMLFLSRLHFETCLAAVLAVLILLGGTPRGLAEPVAIPGPAKVIDLELSPGVSPRLKAVASRWTKRSATAIAAYYLGFHVRNARIQVDVGSGHETGGGHSYNDRGPLIQIDLGRDSTEADVADDWILTHEMQHLHFPSLPDKNHWLEEGLATYVEPIARARASLLKPERVWGDLVERLPEGFPHPGDHGLDGVTENSRVYWGGCLYCLRADVEIRRRTGNRKGLEHALRAIVAAGGMITADWPIERTLAVGDRATGTTVLSELYQEMKAKPVTIDLDSLWQKLGVVHHGSRITFDDRAPWSAIRRSITAR